MSTVARPHSRELQVPEGARLSVHGTAQRVHMGQGAARSVGAWTLLCASLQSGRNAKPLLSRPRCSNEDRATHGAAGNCGSKIPHFTQCWVKGKRRAADPAGGQCRLGAEGRRRPELRQPGAAAGAAGAPLPAEGGRHRGGGGCSPRWPEGQERRGAAG